MRLFLLVILLFPQMILAASVHTSNTEPSVNLLFWNNKNLGFGHVSMEVRSGDPKDSIPAYYLSYAMGNSLDIDMKKHRSFPKKVKLPLIKENLVAFGEWFRQSPYFDPNADGYGNDYSLFSHNCAHAVLSALDILGYDLGANSPRPFGLRPHWVFHRAKLLAQQLDVD